LASGNRVELRSARGPATGRQLVMSQQGNASALSSLLRNAAGLRAALASDFDRGSAAICIRADEAVVYETLRTALLDADPDQLRSLSRHPMARALLFEPERRLRASELIRDPGAAEASLGDTAFVTWGVQATRASASRYTGRGIRIAILDTGIDVSHPDFAGRRIECKSFIPGRVAVTDASGHGTLCAGIAAGPEQPRDAPRYGVASNADLYVVKVLEDDAQGTDGNVLAGIDWAVRNQCAVVSLSVGTPVHIGDSYPQIYEQAAAEALAAGTVLIAPAGNTSERPGSVAPVDHPANCPSVISVGAVDHQLAVAPFSNGGVNDHGGEVNVVAPGVAVVSAAPGPALYQVGSGTSTAAPFVAGVAALLAEADPHARGAQLRVRLLAAVRPLSGPMQDVGAGLVQAPP
jgi:subtilisin